MSERLCRNCGSPFTPVHRLAGPLDGFRVPDDYEYGPSRIYHCSEECRRAFRRKHDREQKREKANHVHRPVKALLPGTGNDNAPNAGENIYDRCQLCGHLRHLRYDSYGFADDDKLDADPCFCSADCVVKWWKSRPGERPDVSLDITRLLGRWNANEAKAWHDWLDDDWGEFGADDVL